MVLVINFTNYDVCTYVFVGSCLATKVFIGKLSATEGEGRGG